MLIADFRRQYAELGGVYVTDKVVLLREPLELYSLTSGEVIQRFNSLEDALAYDLDGKTLEQRVSDWTEIVFVYDGGRGGSSGMKEFSFGHAGGGGGDADLLDYPARLNVILSGKSRSPEDMLRAFRALHANDAVESGITVDEHGFVTKYVHGGPTSVAIRGGKGEMVYHNHPGGGNFSDSDLISVSMGAERGIVASGKFGDYKLVKTDKFKASEFVKAVKTAKMRGHDYNDAADRWLKANQKKYGYKYSFTKA